MLNNSISFIINELPIPLIIGGIAFLFMFFSIINLILNRKRRKKHAMIYSNMFSLYYDETHDIRKTLIAVQGRYKASSTEYEIIKNALYHLDHSILRDYDTALQIISDSFHSPEVEKMHKKYIELQATLKASAEITSEKEGDCESV